MYYRDKPLIQPASGLDDFYDFGKKEGIEKHRKDLGVSNLRGESLPDNVHVDWITLRGVPAAKISVDHSDKSKLLFHIHGGAFNGGVPCTGQQAMIDIQQKANVDIVSIDYGLAPEHPYPDGFYDCINAYRGVLDMGYHPKDIVLIGESAGGNLCLSVSLYLKENNLPLPAALIMLSPVVQFPDYKLLEKQLATNPDNKKLYESIMTCKIYIGEHSIDDPYISPIKGDFNGLPPMFIQCGGSEPFAKQCADCAAVAAAADVDVLLHVWRYMPHVFLLNNDIPEAKDARNEIAAYLQNIFYNS